MSKTKSHQKNAANKNKKQKKKKEYLPQHYKSYHKFLIIKTVWK